MSTRPQTFIKISERKYIDMNNRLSREYVREKDPFKRRDIIGLLYKLDFPLFKSWNVFNQDDRDDFEQEAYFWIKRALESFDPDQGAFIHYLKRYFIRKAWRSEGRKHSMEIRASQLLGTEEANSSPELSTPGIREVIKDHILWKRIQEELTDQEWKILKGILFENHTNRTLSEKLGLGEQRIWALRKSAIHKIIRILNTDSHKKPDETEKYKELVEEDGNIKWLKTTEFARKMSFSYDHVRKLIDKTRRCVWYIDPRDIIRKPVPRIRYLCLDGGLVYPRFLRKK